MGIRTYAMIAVGLAAGLAIAILVRDDPQENTAPPASPHAMGGAPGKDNVSRSIRETVAHLKAVVEKNPKDTARMIELARLLHDAHQPGEAAAYYERALAVGEVGDSARIDYSLCLFQIGKVEQALEQNRVVHRRNGRNAQALYNIGAIHANSGRRDSAVVYWQRLTAVAPDDPLAPQARTNLEKLSAHF